MTVMDKEQLIAAGIADILSHGMDLNESTLGFMDSTLGAATPEILEAVMMDPENCERDVLLELIFFPDENCQIRLEDILCSNPAADPRMVARYLETMIDQVAVRFPGTAKTISLDFSQDLVKQFVSRLRIWNNPVTEMEEAVRRHVAPEKIGPVLIRLRNADFSRSSHIIRFFCHFFAKMDSHEQTFLRYVDFLVRFAGSLHQTIDIFKALMERKQGCLQAMEKALAYESQLKKYNMEVMILKGCRNPCISMEDLQATIAMINHISFILFGRSDYPDAGGQKVDFGFCNQKEDLEKMIRLLS